MSSKFLNSQCWDLELDRQIGRVKLSFGRNEEHGKINSTIVIALQFVECSTPYNIGWEGVFIPPTLLLHSKNAPSILPEVYRLQQGYLVILQGRTVRLGHSYPDHMFHGARRTSAMIFAGLCGPSPSSFITSKPPITSRRFWMSLSGPSAITSARLRGAPPSSFASSTLPACSKGSGRHLRAPNIDEFRGPPTSGSDCRPCSHQSREEE